MALKLFQLHCDQKADDFYAPGIKGLRGASCNRIVCLLVQLSVILSHLHIKCSSLCLKFGWGYSNPTWTVSSFKVCSHFTDITYPLEWGMVIL